MNSPTSSHPTRSGGRWRALIAGILVALPLAGCAHRSTATVAGSLAIPADVFRVRIEVSNGTIDIGAQDEANPSDDIVYKGGVRRDAGSAEELTQLNAVPIELTAELDPEAKDTLVIRGPRAPAGVTGMIALEAGIRIPAGLELEVVVTGNGHVTMVGRRARSKVETRRGDLRFEDCRGGIEAHTGQGVLIAFEHRGDLDVRTDNGDMQAFVEEPGEVLTLATGKGTVQCHIPEDLEFEVDARAEMGRIGNDFRVPVRKIGDYSAAMTGKIGAGDTKIILRTAAGQIDLRVRDA
ncbi:MAG: DUF4097 family beta strand repeat-containing protein [Planctomycetota bacterium]